MATHTVHQIAILIPIPSLAPHQSYLVIIPIPIPIAVPILIPITIPTPAPIPTPASSLTAPGKHHANSQDQAEPILPTSSTLL